MKTLVTNLGAVLVVVNCLSFDSAAAQAQVSYVAPSINHPNNATRCRAGSRVPVNSTSLERKSKAEAEWNLFGKQEIDHLGTIVQFGGSEAENHEVRPLDGDFVRQSPWRNVWRYWSVLYGGSDSAVKVLNVSGRSAAPASAGDQPLGGKVARSVSEISAATSYTDDDAKLLVQQSLIRSAIIDTPWSAAFISAMHSVSGMPSVLSASNMADSGTFRMSSGHVDYIKDAYWTSTAEQNDQIQISRASNSYLYDSRFNAYRACDPTTTVPRVGDMYCSIRLNRLENPQQLPLFRLYGENLISFTPTLPASHCDIVVEVDRDKSKVKVIGGNVNQSVTRRTLNLAGGSLTLNPSRAQVRAAVSTDEACNEGVQCRINDRPWFVLMQIR